MIKEINMGKPTVSVAANLRRELMGRMRSKTAHRAYFERTINAALDIAANVADEQERMQNDKRFSALGREEYLSGIVKDTLAPKLAQGAAREARNARLQNESKQVALGRPDFPKDDLIGELQRQEMRTYLRTQPPEKKMQVAFELATDKTMGEAIFFGNAAALIGLPQDQFAQAKRVFLNHHYADELAEHEAMKEDIAAVSSAVQYAWTQLASISGMSDHQFTQHWKALEAEAN